MNTDEAYDLLREAGIVDSIDSFRQCLRDGKIKTTGFTIDERDLRRFMKEYPTTYLHKHKGDKIQQLKRSIKARDEHIRGVEELHESATKTFIQQRSQLYDEITTLKVENVKLRKETIELLKENIKLRDEIISLKEKLQSKNSSNQEFTNQNNFMPVPDEYRQKLGLSKMAGYKDILAAYKELLKQSHPDRGGNAKLFQYIKSDYDGYKSRISK